MRAFLIVVVVLGLAFFAALIWGGSDEQKPQSPEDAQQHMSKSSWGSVFTAIGDRFAPKLELTQKRFDVDAIRAPKVEIDVPRSSQSTRIAKFALVAGEAIEIHYDCRTSAGADCSSTLCVLRTAQNWPPDCDANSHNSSRGEGSLVIRGEGGKLIFKVLHGPATAELK
jgi:hypothetical protein